MITTQAAARLGRPMLLNYSYRRLLRTSSLVPSSRKSSTSSKPAEPTANSPTSSSSSSSKESKGPSKSNNPGELPAFSFSGLGASRGVKIVLLVALSIVGTAESYFYLRAGLRWWRGEGKKASEEAV